jgi:acetylornithine deacetylase
VTNRDRDRDQAVFTAVDDLLPWAVRLLCDLIAERSLTGAERSAQERIASVFRNDLELDVDEWCPALDDVATHPSFSDDGEPLGERPVVVGRWGADPSRPTLTLNGHIDVVPTGDPGRWSHDPWVGTVVGDRVYGRGACDMKGGLVAAILAVRATRRAGVEPAVNVLLQSVIGEESGGVGTLAAIVRGHVGDAAVILEPTGLDVCPVGAGSATFRLRVRGRAAHGALRRDGVSAIDLFHELCAEIARLETRRHDGFRHPVFPEGFLVAPISIGRVVAGDWPSTVPETLVAEGRFGVFPGERLADARAEFEVAITRAASAWRAEGIALPTVEWFEGQFAPAATPLDAGLLDALGRCHAEVVGRAAVTRGVPYGSDLRFFTNDAGIPAVLYGPGDVARAHAADEYVELDEVRAVAKVISLLLLRGLEPPAR